MTRVLDTASCGTGALAFVVLSHGAPSQLMRLTDRLGRLYGSGPIVCHHDLTQAPLDTAAYGSRVHFVQPHVPTRWGDFSLVQAMLRAFETLLAEPTGWDWCVILSGSDYPVAPARTVHEDLARGAVDAHIQHEPIGHSGAGHDWQPLFADRYLARRVRLPVVSRRLRRTTIDVRIPPGLPLVGSPFSNRFRCYGGSMWFTARRRALEHIVEWNHRNPWLARWYRRVPIPDESFFHCILANESGMRLSSTTWRYVDWSAQGAHPKTLEETDFAPIVASGAHFARKFDADGRPAVLDLIDRHLGIA